MLLSIIFVVILAILVAGHFRNEHEASKTKSKPRRLVNTETNGYHYDPLTQEDLEELDREFK